MTVKTLTIAALSVVSVLSAVQPAAATDWRIDIVRQRLAEQEQRIQSGRAAGDITWSEAYRLRQEQRRVARMLQRAIADDDYIDRDEFARLNELQNETARHIRDERTDTDVRWWKRGGGYGRFN